MSKDEKHPDSTDCEPGVAPDPFDPAQFRMSNVLSPGGDGVRRELTHLKVGKPSKSVFFRSHPSAEFQMDCRAIEDDTNGTKETYLVLPDVALELPQETKAKLLKLCVTRQGVPFLWPVPHPLGDEGHRSNLWNDTAMKAATLSETKWTRMVANMNEGAYVIYTSDGVDEPQWPSLSMGQLIRLAFGEDKVVRSLDHPLVRRLLGRE